MLLPPGRGCQLRQRDSRESTLPAGSRTRARTRRGSLAGRVPHPVQTGTHLARKRPGPNQTEPIEPVG